MAAVHHHLVRTKTRTRVGLVVESGDAREVHHMALLKGFGAAAINPYLAFESIDDMIASGLLTGVTPRQAQKNYIKAASKGIVKVMSKMGISTVASYTGAQVFEAVGLATEVVDEYFTGTVSRIGGVGLDVLAAEVATATAWPTSTARPNGPTASGRSAASTSGAARGRSTSSTRGRSSSSSTPPGPSGTASSRSTPRRSTTSRRHWPPCGA